ncbi:MAG: ubiquinone biosynthesis protein [Nitrosomonas sp.]|nr:ubiquinone biosynthesis protein [Nitrosomonas sp.]
MLTPITVSSINHILQSENWARKRLQVYQGKVVRIRILPFPDFNFSIQADGKISTIPDNTSIDAVITITPALLFRKLTNENDETVFNDIKISGDDALAKDIISIGRQLRWDLEQDLSEFFGDIFSYRIVQTSENLIHWHSLVIQNFSQALSEYLVEEQPTLVNHNSVNEFRHNVEILFRDTEQLEQRIMKLIVKKNNQNANTTSGITEDN